MGLPRKEHWATRAYHDFLVSRAHSAFEWGKNDCALFAADGIHAITGVDIASDFRGRYSDEAEALALIRQVCNGMTIADAAAYCAQKHGLTEWTAPLSAQRGDLVIAQQPDGSLIAGLIHLNGRHVVTVSSSGLVRLPIRSIVRAWHV